ncbi:MAG: magnesium chelatase [Ferruginibacter sp.]|jgi:MoxR-like ATPase|uniref:AAA family ATPase n=1 Tax=Ferruginibacter sp. TaxID=1940288 RepID=UPI002657DEAB|nr:MoxR family ATPase [Ferruginibacter sp.]MDB5278206.1 magnesium chelatase [Ferruginibacter sp.]
MEEEVFQQRTDLSALNQQMQNIRNEIGKVIVGQYKMLDLLMIGLLCDGHILIEGVPGVAKTLTAKLMAKIIDVDFSRIQFTPDLMPSDVVGTSVFNPKEGDFYFKPGPVFSNIILIDEINRAPAKTQAALFEVMEERQVTVDGVTHEMRFPFIILATQNPVEQEGTYRLPEAQLDRFIFKIDVQYPNLHEEIGILNNQHGNTQLELLGQVNKIVSVKEIHEYRALIQSIVVEPRLIEFIARIVIETRNNPALYLGASPRASLAILRASKASAAIKGRDFVTPEDIVEMASPVLRHRIILTPEKEMEGVTADDLIENMLKSIEVPR